MIYFLAFVVLELRPDEQDIFQTRQDMIGADGKGLLYLVQESWNRDPKLWIYNPTPKRQTSVPASIQRRSPPLNLPNNKTLPSL